MENDKLDYDPPTRAELEADARREAVQEATESLEEQLTAANARIAELERANEQLRLEDGLIKFYQTKERIAELEAELTAERTAHLATREALVSLELCETEPQRIVCLFNHREAITAARERVAQAKATTKGKS